MQISQKQLVSKPNICPKCRNCSSLTCSSVSSQGSGNWAHSVTKFWVWGRFTLYKGDGFYTLPMVGPLAHHQGQHRKCMWFVSMTLYSTETHWKEMRQSFRAHTLRKGWQEAQPCWLSSSLSPSPSFFSRIHEENVCSMRLIMLY